MSGIVLDALLHGAPVVATAGTWAGRQVARFGAGEVLEERTVDALEAAIDTVQHDWEARAGRACAAARILAAEHDPANLLQALESGDADP